MRRPDILKNARYIFRDNIGNRDGIANGADILI